MIADIIAKLMTDQFSYCSTTSIKEPYVLEIHNTEQNYIELPLGINHNYRDYNFDILNTSLPLNTNCNFGCRISTIKDFLFYLFFGYHYYKNKSNTYFSNTGMVVDIDCNIMLLTTKIIDKEFNNIVGINLYVNPIVFYRIDTFCTSFVKKTLPELLKFYDEHKTNYAGFNVFIKDPIKFNILPDPPTLTNMDAQLKSILENNIEDIIELNTKHKNFN